MKKKYTAPEVKNIKVNPSAIICVSAGFGDGETDVMFSRRNEDFEDDFGDE